jgi:hypothetical protein
MELLIFSDEYTFKASIVHTPNWVYVPGVLLTVGV